MNGEREPVTTREEMPQLLLESQLCFPLYAASRKVVNRYTPYFKPLGITYTQYIVFLALWESGSAKVGDLCRRLYLAGLDVLADEHPSLDNPLFQMDNVIVSPHIAYYSEGSDVDLRNGAINQVIGALEHGEPQFFVNRKALGR